MTTPRYEDDAALDRLLALTGQPPRPRATLAREIAAKARHASQLRPSYLGGVAAGMALAASLAFGIWIGGNDTASQWLPQIGFSAQEAGISPDDLVEGGDVL